MQCFMYAHSIQEYLLQLFNSCFKHFAVFILVVLPWCISVGFKKNPVSSSQIQIYIDVMTVNLYLIYIYFSAMPWSFKMAFFMDFLWFCTDAS